MDEWKKDIRTVAGLIDRYVWVASLPRSAEGWEGMFRDAEDALAEELYKSGPVVWQSKVWSCVIPVRMGRFGETAVRNAFDVPVSWVAPEAVVVTAPERAAGYDGTESPS